VSNFAHKPTTMCCALALPGAHGALGTHNQCKAMYKSLCLTGYKSLRLTGYKSLRLTGYILRPETWC